MSMILHDEYDLATNDVFRESMRVRFCERLRAELRPTAGTREAVERLWRAGCVASLCQRERIRLSLAFTGLINLFKPNIFLAIMATPGKSAPNLFPQADHEFSYQPESCVIVEDGSVGVEAAKSAGMRVFPVTGDIHMHNDKHRKSLSNLSSDILFKDIGELLQLVGQGAYRFPAHGNGGGIAVQVQWLWGVCISSFIQVALMGSPAGIVENFPRLITEVISVASITNWNFDAS